VNQQAWIGAAAIAAVACSFSPVFGASKTTALPDLPFVLHAEESVPQVGDDVLTERGNNRRTGAYVQPGLNQAIFERGWGEIDPGLSVTGTVYAQPLVVSRLTMKADRHEHDVVFVATAQNHVYAFDAHSLELLWHRQLPPLPVPGNGNDPDNGNDRSEVLLNGERLGCNNLSGAEGIGLEATPVIDRQLGRMFVSYRIGQDRNPDKAEQWLAAIDLASGEVLTTKVEPPARPLEWPKWDRSRSSLLLVDGVVYVGFGSRCEDQYTPRFEGWLLAYDGQTLRRVGAFGPNEQFGLDGAGIWQGSVGPAADENGDVYVMTGNRRIVCSRPGNHEHYDDGRPDDFNFSESIIRLEPTALRNPQGELISLELRPADYFTPYRRVWLDERDMDLGASGIVLLPESTYLLGGGKEGILYLVDRGDMGGFDPNHWKMSYWCDLPPGITEAEQLKDDPARDRVRQKLRVGKNRDVDVPSPRMDDWMMWPHVHGAPAFARFSSFAGIYIWPEKDFLKSFRWRSDERFDPEPLTSSLPMAPVKPDNWMPGGMISVAVDPTVPDGGVVFATAFIAPKGPNGRLYALDPVSLRELWRSPPYPFVKYVPPTIAEGRVFLPSINKVLVFGRQ
jgi:outer membrane protein assembly factor BamB